MSAVLPDVLNPQHHFHYKILREEKCSEVYNPTTVLNEEVFTRPKQQLKQDKKHAYGFYVGIVALSLVIAVFVVVTVTGTMAAQRATKGGSSAEALERSVGNAAFTKTMYDLLKNEPGNVFFSPISMEMVLALAYMGAGGETARQMRTGVHLPESREELLKQFGPVMSVLQNPAEVTLKLANAAFTQAGFPINPEYLKSAQAEFMAEVRPLDFQQQTEAARLEINKYVEQNTANKIQDLFVKGALDASTVLVLVNAIYFKGNWAKKFDPALTKKAPFHLNARDSVEVDFMHQKAQFKYAFNEELNAHVVELPYQGDELSMVLLVPKEVEGILLMEEKLSTLDLTKITTNLFKREIQLAMPKFKLEKSMDLEDVLQQLGMTDMFSDKADFTGIAPNLQVSKVVQKAFIEVNEEGSEAAAATGMKIQMRMMPLPPIQVNANVPFLFYLNHKQGATLFSGRVAIPAN